MGSIAPITVTNKASLIIAPTKSKKIVYSKTGEVCMYLCNN